MDFTFTEEQETISKLARDLFERRATPERLAEIAADESGYDERTWPTLKVALDRNRPPGARKLFDE